MYFKTEIVTSKFYAPIFGLKTCLKPEVKVISSSEQPINLLILFLDWLISLEAWVLNCKRLTQTEPQIITRHCIWSKHPAEGSSKRDFKRTSFVLFSLLSREGGGRRVDFRFQPKRGAKIRRGCYCFDQKFSIVCCNSLSVSENWILGDLRI